MKWIKTAIGALIAISVLPLVVLSVINIKESLETEKITVTTELEYYEELIGVYEFKLITHYDDLRDYIEEGYTIANLYDYTNDINITITNCIYEPTYFQIFDNYSVSYMFYDNTVKIDAEYESVYNANVTDIALMDITFTKSKSKGNLTTTLLSFVPLVFVGGVVLFFYKPFKKD